jgi:NifU-like protein involved in Fe-S cluster formation
MYSDIVRSHAVRPQNRGPLAGANAQGASRYPRCGDTFLLQLRIEDDVIVDARFQAQACAPVVAMGSVGCSMLRGLSLSAARQLSAFDLDRALGGLPPAKRHAILLFLEAVYEAAESYVKINESENFNHA